MDTPESGILDAQLFSEKGDFASCFFKLSLQTIGVSVILAAHPCAAVNTVKASELVWRTAGLTCSGHFFGKGISVNCDIFILQKVLSA